MFYWEQSNKINIWHHLVFNPAFLPSNYFSVALFIFLKDCNLVFFDYNQKCENVSKASYVVTPSFPQTESNRNYEKNVDFVTLTAIFGYGLNKHRAMTN